MYGSTGHKQSYNLTYLATSNVPTGPLTYTENEQTFVVGVVGYARKNPCGDPHYPGVYARVTKALDWIRREAAKFRKFNTY